MNSRSAETQGWVGISRKQEKKVQPSHVCLKLSMEGMGIKWEDEEGKGPGHVSADLILSGRKVAVVDAGGLGGGSSCPAIAHGCPVVLLGGGTS